MWINLNLSTFSHVYIHNRRITIKSVIAVIIKMIKNPAPSLTKIQYDLIVIIVLLNKAYFRTINCLELKQNSELIQNKLLKVMQILLKLFSLISEQHPQSSIFHHLSSDFKNHSQINYLAHIQKIDTSKPFNITQLNKTISNITILLDRSAINCKFCPELGIRPYVKIIATAMAELFQLQQQYIYPIRPDLIPSFLIQNHKLKK